MYTKQGYICDVHSCNARARGRQTCPKENCVIHAENRRLDLCVQHECVFLELYGSGVRTVEAHLTAHPELLDDEPLVGRMMGDVICQSLIATTYGGLTYDLTLPDHTKNQ